MSATPPLRVLVNLTWLVPGVVGGSEESTTDALRGLLEYRPDIELRLAVLRSFAGAHPDLVQGCACDVLDRSGDNKALRVLAEQSWLARRVIAMAPDVVHHAGGVVPLRHPGRSVVTIHDLQPLDLPGNFSWIKRGYLRLMLRRSVRAAEVVCVPSTFTARRVVERLGAVPDRVHVVPWSVVGSDGADRAGDREGTTSPGGGRGAGPAASGDPTFLYPAITYPHKNHRVLLEAFSRFVDARPTARLVLAGGVGPQESAVVDRIRRPDLVGRVQRPGRVTDAEMDRLYRSATAVLLPSRYEGFGLPALEAMHRGVPLVVSSAGSLPEVVTDDEGVSVTPVAPLDPDDVTGWTAAMAFTADLDDRERAAVGAAERARAAAFNGRRTADALAGAYHRAAERPSTLGRP